MTARIRALALVAAAVLLVVACGGESAGEASAAPEGYRMLEHSDAVVAVPSDWTEADDAVHRDEGLDVVQYDSPESPALSMLMWRLAQTAHEGTTVVGAAELVVAERQFNPGFEYVANDPVEVAGADDAHLVRVRWESGPTTVYQTVIAARLGDKAVVVTFAGTDDHPPDEAVEVALDTMRVR